MKKLGTNVSPSFQHGIILQVYVTDPDRPVEDQLLTPYNQGAKTVDEVFEGFEGFIRGVWEELGEKPPPGKELA
jgi:hypothetical protein